jgi:hypothetical protein
MTRVLLLSVVCLAWGLVAGVEAARGDDAPPFQITTRRDSDRVTVKIEEDRAIFDIRSPFGISNATIERTAAHWPQRVTLRLHLKGLEHFQITGGDLKVAGSAPRQPKPTPSDEKESDAADNKRPLEATIRMFDASGKPASKVPLESGCFEVDLPVRLIETNPKTLRLEWVDFYRN